MLHVLVVDQRAVANSLRYMSQSEVLRTREREFCFLGAAITYLVTLRQCSSDQCRLSLQSSCKTLDACS